MSGGRRWPPRWKTGELDALGVSQVSHASAAAEPAAAPVVAPQPVPVPRRRGRPSGYANRDRIHWEAKSEMCPRCGYTTCVCQRWPGFNVEKWEGEQKNYAFTPDELLRAAVYEAIKPDVPLDRFVAVLRFFAETEPDYRTRRE